jgi:RNA polymerase sigma-70 factor (ECF subfamily)
MKSTQALGFEDLRTDANDTNVMSGVQAQDRRAFEKLYLTYYGTLARFLARFVAPTSAAEEIIDDTFMTIWSCAMEFRGESRVAAWIFAILYRTAIQSMEPSRLRGRLPFAGIFRRHDSEFASENPYNDRFDRRLNRLPLEERVTLALAYQMGFSIDEIATITQVAPATVEMRMNHARRDLRDN